MEKSGKLFSDLLLATDRCSPNQYAARNIPLNPIRLPPRSRARNVLQDSGTITLARLILAQVLLRCRSSQIQVYSFRILMKP